MDNSPNNPSSEPEAKWRETLISADTTVQQTIRNLDVTGMQIAMVVASTGVLLGTVTDGDIRRGLLRGLGLDSSIAEIVYSEPLVVPPQMGREMVLQLMHANKIHQLPIVDEKRRVVGLHVWADMIAPGQRSNLMVLMAGGRGERLGSHTESCPKPLLKVSGKPMLEHIIQRANAQGFHRFVLAVHYLGEMIEEYFGDGSSFGVDIEYLREPAPLGTAGSLSLLKPPPSSAFVVSNGDVLTDINYAELLDFHIRHKAAGTMAVRLHEWKHPFGVVQTDGVDIVGFEEKPVTRSHVNAGVYVLDPSALHTLATGEHCDMPTLFSRLQQGSKRTIVYPMHEPWLDVGRPEDLNIARNP